MSEEQNENTWQEYNYFPSSVYILNKPGFLDVVRQVLFKNLNITVPVKSEKDKNGVDYNICCEGLLKIDKETSTAVIGITIDK